MYKVKVKNEKSTLPTLCCTCKGWKFLRKRSTDGVGLCLFPTSEKFKKTTDYSFLCDKYKLYKQY